MRTWSEDHPKARLLERKQEAIKVAARALFLQHGYANTTIEMVAAQAGVSIMTLYRHFRGKDVLFQAVIQHLCSQKAQEGREMIWLGNPAKVLHQLGRLCHYPRFLSQLSLMRRGTNRIGEPEEALVLRHKRRTRRTEVSVITDLFTLGQETGC